MNFKALAARFTEPSSWAGVAAAMAVLAPNLDSSVWTAVTYLGAGMATLLAVFIPEQSA
jgi:hypothetical protein